jgi:hypothetical protein
LLKKSYNLFMDDWRAHQRTNEQYYAWGGSAGGDIHYTWGALLCLIPMEQFIDENPWNGLRFGALQPSAEGQLLGVMWRKHQYDVTIGPNLTSVKRDGQLRFEANAGVVVRDYRFDDHGVSFSVKTLRTTQVRTMEEKARSISLKIDDRLTRHLGVQNGAIRFTLPPGNHKVSEAWDEAR